MKKTFTLILLFLSVYSFAQVENDSRILNQFIIMLKPAHSIKEVSGDFPSLQIKKCLSKRMNIWLVENNTSVQAESFLLALQKNGNIKLAQFNHKVKQRSLIPNDPYFNLQWDMLNTGQYNGTPGDDIDATDAWQINHNNVTVNGDTIVIAVIDGTFDLNHEDLNYFINHHEIPGNNTDDDSDGYVDDVCGWNFQAGNGDVNSTGADAYHSTHCAGIAAAVGNNGKGIAGVCWGAKILPITGVSGSEAEVVEAYNYALTMRTLYNNTSGARGAFVVATNSSFGLDGNDGGQHADFPIWCAMYDSLGKEGILSAAATANIGWDIDVNDDMPTGCPSNYLIAVTNTNYNDNLTGGSAWGDTSIDLGAPGRYIYSTVPPSSYTLMSGTSMASPHVAGTVAAMFAAACPKLLDDYSAFPDSIALLVKQMILSGTTHISDLYNKSVSGGTLNLYRCIKNLDEYNCNNCDYGVSLSVHQPSCSNTCDGAIKLFTTPNHLYNYNWSTAQSGTDSISNLCPGFYSVTVSETGSGCQQIRNFSLSRPDSIVISSVNIIPATDSTTGNITVIASAGNYNLLYSIDSINYQSGATFSVPSNGNYNVYVKSETGCVIEQNISVSGVEEIMPNGQLRIYPNPVNDILNISLSLSKEAPVRFSILNILGATLLDETKEIGAGIHTATTDLSLLESGVYLLRISAGNSSSTRKFVIAK